MKQILEKEYKVYKKKSRRTIAGVVSVTSINLKRFIGKRVLVKVYIK